MALGERGGFSLFGRLHRARNDLSMHAFQKLALAELAGWGRSFGRCLSRILFHTLCISVLRQFLCMARLWSRASFSLC